MKKQKLGLFVILLSQMLVFGCATSNSDQKPDETLTEEQKIEISDRLASSQGLFHKVISPTSPKDGLALMFSRAKEEEVVFFMWARWCTACKVPASKAFKRYDGSNNPVFFSMEVSTDETCTNLKTALNELGKKVPSNCSLPQLWVVHDETIGTLKDEESISGALK